MNECDSMVKKHAAKKTLDKNNKIESQKKLEAAMSSKGLGLQNVKNTSSILAPPKH